MAVEMDSEAVNILREDEATCKSELKSGNIINPDCLFKDLAIDICEKYIEIGIELKLEYKVLINELETGEFKTQTGSRKALRMLQLWRDSVDEDGCTYSVLATALEKNGFHCSAVKYCYTSTEGRELGYSHHYLRGQLLSASSDRETSFDSQHTVSRMSSCASGGSFDKEMSIDLSRKERAPDEETQDAMRRNQDTIEDHFVDLIEQLRDASRSLDAKEVHRYLSDRLQRKIPHSGDLQKMYTFLSTKKHWTYQHYDLVERLNKRFLGNSLAQAIKEYKDKLSGYFAAKRIISSEFFQDSQSQSECTTQSVTEYDHEHRNKLRLRLRLRRQLSDECLNYVAELWDSLRDTFELPSITALIDKIIEKCLEITWLILPSDANMIIDHAKDHHSFFREKNIILLTVDGRTIYEEGKKPKEKQECVYKKLFGRCRNRSCTYKHGGVKSVETPKHGYFRHPMGLRHSLKNVIGKSGHTDSNEAYIVLQSDKDPHQEVKILAESASALEDVMRWLTVITGRKYAERYVALCYVHPKGIEDPHQCFKFQQQRSSKDDHSIVKVRDRPKLSDEASKSYNLDTFLTDFHGKRYGSEPVSEWLKDPKSIPTSFSNRMIYEPHILDDVHDKLRQALEWVGEKDQFKLRGRFGKLNFSKVDKGLRDVDSCDTARVIQYLFQSPKYKCFFNTKISEESSSLVKSCLSDTGSTLEAYELKLGINNTHRLGVHLEFKDGRPVVTQLKADDSRLLMVDVMCLNHDHDLRLDLSSFKISSPEEYPTFCEFISRVEMKFPHTISLVPVGPNQEWNVSIIRQKSTKAYHLDCPEGKKYLVTISSVREYKTKERDLKMSDDLEIDMDTIKEEIEIEIHNLLWDVSVASQFGQSPEDYLRVLMEPGSIPSELKSFDLSRYGIDMILREFKREDFLQLMNNVNRAMVTTH